MVQAFALLLLCQVLGEGVVRLFGLSVPGPVMGMILLAAALLVRKATVGPSKPINDTPLGTAANGLLGHLSLLFVPAGVGIVQQGGLILNNGVALIAALVISTVLALAVTAVVFVAVSRATQREPRP